MPRKRAYFTTRYSQKLHLHTSTICFVRLSTVWRENDSSYFLTWSGVRGCKVGRCSNLNNTHITIVSSPNEPPPSTADLHWTNTGQTIIYSIHEHLHFLSTSCPLTFTLSYPHNSVTLYLVHLLLQFTSSFQPWSLEGSEYFPSFRGNLWLETSQLYNILC